MAIVGTGIDLERVASIERAIARHGVRFLTRVFTADEIAYCQGRAKAAQSFAARFCAKEALRKALGAPPGIRWVDVEVRRAPSGAPSLALHGRAAEWAARAGVTRIHVSLTHSGDCAMAQVILEGAP